MKQPASHVSWRDVFWSTVVIIAGWTLAAWFVGRLWSRSSNDGLTEITLALLFLLLGGLAVGAVQWLVTARRLAATAWWMLAYGVGWAAGLWCGFRVGFLWRDPLQWVLMGGVGGLLVGVMQWITFRRYLDRAGWWVPLSMVISLAGCWIGVWSGFTAHDHFNFNDPAAFLVGGAACGVVVGFLTAVALRWLVMRSSNGRPSP